MRILLVGNPNCGKSTLFNSLTGLNQKTGNFFGVTVEKKSGFVGDLEIIDLPGAYSLEGNSEEKKLTGNLIRERNPGDVVLFVMDPLQMERSLHFFLSIQELGIPVSVVITMEDVMPKKGISLNAQALWKKLGVNGFYLNAKNKTQSDLLKHEILTKREGFFLVRILDEKKYKFQKSSSIETSGNTITEDEYIQRSIRIKKILSDVILSKFEAGSGGKSSSSPIAKLDSIFLHPFYGLVFFFGLMFLLFQSIFFWAEIPMKGLENLVGVLQSFLLTHFPDGILKELLVDGVLKGVGSVVVFLPQIALLFFFITVLEELGYMSRASFLMDRIMGKVGLSGKSFIPLLSSSACAVPAILSTRVIENKSDRLTTIMVSPLVMCSARYPVYILVVGAVFPAETRGLVLFGMFCLGMFSSMFFAYLFRTYVFKENPSYFLLEIPSYKLPSYRSVFIPVYSKVKAFLETAGKNILYITVILWFLASFPKNNLDKTNILDSYAGKIGKSVEFVLEPLGFDWKIGISLITSFAAREVMVSTLAVIYGVQEQDDLEESKDLYERMRAEKRPDGSKIWTPLTGICVLIFFAFASQCASTLAVVKKETGSYIFPLFQFFYMTSLAILSTFIVHTIGKLLGF